MTSTDGSSRERGGSWALVAAVMFGAALVPVVLQVGMFQLRPGAPAVATMVGQLLPFWMVRAALGLVLWGAADRVLRRRPSLPRAVGIHVVGAAAYWVVWSGLVALSPVLPPSYTGSYAERVLQLMQASSIISPFIYACVVGAHHAVHYLRVARQAEVRAAELEGRLAQARLDTLRAQLNPHFLFNTLNGITSLALQGDHDRVVAALGLLGDLLRSALADGDLTTLDREFAFAGQYLELQGMRLGDRLSVVWETDPCVGRCRVPVMVLQPLIENALVHGVEPRAEGGWVRVRARRHGARVRVDVADSGPGPSAALKVGTGLAAVEARLRHVYGSDYRLAYARGEGNESTCTIEIPYGADDQDAHR